MLKKGERAIETRQEEAFAIHSQERIMGLLGAMIPQDYKVRKIKFCELNIYIMKF